RLPRRSGRFGATDSRLRSGIRSDLDGNPRHPGPGWITDWLRAVVVSRHAGGARRGGEVLAGAEAGAPYRPPLRRGRRPPDGTLRGGPDRQIPGPDPGPRP